VGLQRIPVQREKILLLFIPSFELTPSLDGRACSSIERMDIVKLADEDLPDVLMSCLKTSQILSLTIFSGILLITTISKSDIRGPSMVLHSLNHLTLDVAIWDNRSAFHSITLDYKVGESRKGDRVVSLGEKPYLDPNSTSRREALGLLGSFYN
jgi:hypothetical protein